MGSLVFCVIAYVIDASENWKGTGLEKQHLGWGGCLSFTVIGHVEATRVSVEQKSPAPGV